MKKSHIAAMAAVVLGIPLLASGIFTFSSVVSAPGRVIQKTLGTGNIITSYEWFFDVYAQIQARVGQITAQKAMMATPTTEPGEFSRRSVELGAMQQSCRDLVTRYNANSAKTNKTIFKDANLPNVLSISVCE